MTEGTYPVLSVSQLTQAIKLSLEGTFPSIWVQGEVSNYKQQTSGHLYFSLKDAEAQIAAVMFYKDAMQLKIPLKDGQQVMAKAELSVYPPSGRYQLIIRELKLAGLGELLLKLEELKIKLNRLGWFKKERKRALPKFPKTIGIVTSPTGAAIQDMIHVLTRRFPGVHILLNPVKVQGEGAALEIVEAIRQFNTHKLADVLIVGRGGGSIEDLWAFNEEIVAQSIFESEIPVISAVGHETDHCIADYVADVRAPTPSAAAEIVSAERSHLQERLTLYKARIVQLIRHLLQRYQLKLEGIKKQPLLASPYAILGIWMQRLDDYRQRLDSLVHTRMQHFKLQIESRQKQLQALNPKVQLLHFRQLLSQKEKQLDYLFNKQITDRKNKFQSIKKILSSIDPKNLLQKGYCILFSEKDHCAITSVHKATPKAPVVLQLADGSLKATINQVIPK